MLTEFGLKKKKKRKYLVNAKLQNVNRIKNL